MLWVGLMGDGRQVRCRGQQFHLRGYHDIAERKFCSGFTAFFFVIFREHFSRETKLCKNQNSFATIEGVS